MKKLLFLLICTSSLNANDYSDFALGPSLQYTRFRQNCLEQQKGFLAGPSFKFDVSYPWRPYAGLFFDGLWDVANLCSEDGVFIDSTQYNVLLKFGFNFANEQYSFMFTPYVGVGFLHLSHEIKEDIVIYRYNNVYVPVGFRFLHMPLERFSWELIVHYRVDAWTRLKVSTPCVCDTEDCNISLKRTHGVFASFPLTWSYGEGRVGFITSLIPTFDWQRFDTVDCCCDEGLTLPIPTLKTWKLGVQALIGITF